ARRRVSGRVLQGERTERRRRRPVAASFQLLWHGRLPGAVDRAERAARQTVHAPPGRSQGLARPLSHLGPRSAPRPHRQAMPRSHPPPGHEMAVRDFGFAICDWRLAPSAAKAVICDRAWEEPLAAERPLPIGNQKSKIKNRKSPGSLVPVALVKAAV